MPNFPRTDLAVEAEALRSAAAAARIFFAGDKNTFMGHPSVFPIVPKIARPCKHRYIAKISRIC